MNVDLEFLSSLESDLNEISRYVAIDSLNYTTFSVELSRIIVAASIEFESLLKAIVKEIDPGFNFERTNLGLLKEPLLEKVSWIQNRKITIRRSGEEIYPLKDWSSSSLFWWNAYTALKHNRSDNFEKATLKSAIYSVAAYGLLVGACAHYLKDINREGRFFELIFNPIRYGA